MDIKLLEEPFLQFSSGQHVCPRAGIYNYTVSDINNVRPDKIVVGFVGSSDSIGTLISWIKQCRSHIDAKKSNQPNLFTNFPGFNSKIAFKSEIAYDESYVRKINHSTFEQVKKSSDDINDLITKSVEIYLTEIKFLSKNKNPDVILCVLDEQFTKMIYGTSTVEVENSLLDEDETLEVEFNFRRLLKARAMEYNIPIQIVRDRIVKPSSEMQDQATIAWNFFTALYYKASGTPWALKKTTNNNTCFAGISFYKSRDKSTTQTSVTQIFNEHGNGVILRGTPVKESKKDKQPHLSEQQAFDLIYNSLTEYYEAVKIFPQRLVIHKSSNYSEEEIEGFQRVAREMKINSIDLVTIMPTNFRLYREKDYPPFRGTMISLDKQRHFLYTRGFVEYYGTYPGRYIPSPIEVRLFSYDESPEQICREILMLTKMNWNNTQFDRKFPITIDCSRNVGEILKYVESDQKPQIKYSFYM
ncbi:hypothetical protein CLV24_105151 [Pontibacter ummariensis]|uniref:Protein argonaute n=1 Tax=Pontibacter ummariensis TaxID=1610492 RepID=A0A239DRZ8_9BACT|nr:hypothetical protein [Pontibacter ummariensis]PRY13781.1 hypothetical protein CLV24_105151 [Pontibacter ummariensis]SNS35260.1 hypothetical protein SAMN06296052_105101 [Pontibacter ummariensis]